MPIREELDGIDIRFVTSKCLNGLSSTDIPHLGESVTGAGDECVLVRGVQADAHDVSQVVGELGHLLARLDIPPHAGHVTGGGEDATVINEAAAREVSCMSRKFPGDTRGTIALLVQVVN